MAQTASRFLRLGALLCLTSALALNAQADPVKLIFDTDMGNDIDDALALALIHEFIDRGEADLLAVTISKDSPWAAPYVDLVNTFYGRPDIPIGVVRNGKTPDTGKYIQRVAERTNHGELVYPRDIGPEDDVPDATALLRRVLASQPDGSVTLVSVGFLTNMARLLNSPPDDFSPLPGDELVRRKVRLYVAMAGAFSWPRRPEYNVHIDAEASRKTFQDWPTALHASGFEIGLAILYPSASIEKDFSYVTNHPVAEAYRLYVDMPDDRPTWDLTAILHAVRPYRNYFDLSYPGKIRLTDKNVTEFVDDYRGAHRFLTANQEQQARVRELFVHFVSSPPGN